MQDETLCNTYYLENSVLISLVVLMTSGFSLSLIHLLMFLWISTLTPRWARPHVRLHQLGDQGELMLIAVTLHDRRPRPTCPTPLRNSAPLATTPAVCLYHSNVTTQLVYMLGWPALLMEMARAGPKSASFKVP